jgi:hypothetical protein
MPYSNALNIEATPAKKAGNPVQHAGLVFYQGY